MFRQVADFEKAWQYESPMTLKLFQNLTDAALAQRVTPQGRSLGKLAWHIVTSLNMISEAGLPIDAPKDDNAVPARVAEILAAYEKGAASVRTQVSAHWSDRTLLEEVPMYGEVWTKGYVLWAMVLHQTHHRAQMTVLLRQAGLKVPGIYGPAREEWADMNMPPME